MRSGSMFRSVLGSAAALAASASLALTASAASADSWLIRSEAIAKAAIEARGYTHVRNLQRDRVGNWAGEAVRGGVEIAVILQLDGDVAEE